MKSEHIKVQNNVNNNIKTNNVDKAANLVLLSLSTTNLTIKKLQKKRTFKKFHE